MSTQEAAISTKAREATVSMYTNLPREHARRIDRIVAVHPAVDGRRMTTSRYLAALVAAEMKRLDAAERKRKARVATKTPQENA